MTRNIIFYTFTLLLTLTVLATAGIAKSLKEKDQQESVLLLNSYDQNMNWVKGITRGVLDTLSQTERSLPVRIENMDTKRISSSEYYEVYANYLRLKYKDVSLSIILASDNNAYDFLRKYRDKIFPNIPVIFCGVNNFQPQQIAHLEDFTGVEEIISFKETVQLISTYHPETTEIFVVNDYLATGRAWAKNIQNDVLDLKGDIKIIFSDDVPIKQLQGEINNLPETAVVLLGVYYSDNHGYSSTYEVIGEELAKESKVPVYCLAEFNINQYVIGGIVISGYSEGSAIASTALKIIDGVAPQTIAVRSTGSNRGIFNYSRLEQYGIEEQQLPQNSIVINRPFSLYEEYYSQVWLIICFIGVLLLVIVFLVMNITKRRLAERLVFAQKVFDNSIEGIVVTDADGTILQVNAAFSKITGYGATEAIGQNPRILKSDKHLPSFYEEMWRNLTTEGQWAGETWNRRKNGEAYPEWLTISAVKNDTGEITHYVSIFHDISQQLQQQEVIQYQAQHDALTELPNRVLINDRLENALEKSQRSGKQVALLYLDIDNFKYINDAFGHTVGDNILVELSRRFSSLMRNGDSIARLGGDDFLVLLTDLEDLKVVSNIAMRLLGSLEKPFYHGDVEFFVTASVGITIAPDDGVDSVTLVKNSDVAMYRAKNLGKNNYQYFAPELDAQVHRRIALEMKLRKALELEEFELYYQPLVHSVSGKITGAEALIRWKCEGKIISPGEFIPMAEDSGLILPMGEWVLKSAARQAKIWKDAGYALTVSVNISSRQFAGQDLFTLLQNVLHDTGLDPGRLYLEVTESMVMGDLASAQRIMGGLRELGAKFYLDDFGTGYSSLAYLKRLPIDGLKIDRSFVKDIVDDPDSEAIAAVITSLANTLNLQIVAEGVETIEQWKMLHEMSEMLIQGYLVSKPVPADEFELLFKKGDIIWRELSLAKNLDNEA